MKTQTTQIKKLNKIVLAGVLVLLVALVALSVSLLSANFNQALASGDFGSPISTGGDFTRLFGDTGFMYLDLNGQNEAFDANNQNSFGDFDSANAQNNIFRSRVLNLNAIFEGLNQYRWGATNTALEIVPVIGTSYVYTSGTAFFTATVHEHNNEIVGIIITATRQTTSDNAYIRIRLREVSTNNYFNIFIRVRVGAEFIVANYLLRNDRPPTELTANRVVFVANASRTGFGTVSMVNYTNNPYVVNLRDYLVESDLLVRSTNSNDNQNVAHIPTGHNRVYAEDGTPWQLSYIDNLRVVRIDLLNNNLTPVSPAARAAMNISQSLNRPDFAINPRVSQDLTGHHLLFEEFHYFRVVITTPVGLTTREIYVHIRLDLSPAPAPVRRFNVRLPRTLNRDTQARVNDHNMVSGEYFFGSNISGQNNVARLNFRAAHVLP